jgi:hypothetical protein
LIANDLEAMGIEPLFPTPTSSNIYEIYERLYPIFRNFRGADKNPRTRETSVGRDSEKGHFSRPPIIIWKHPDSQYWTACFRDQK